MITVAEIRKKAERLFETYLQSIVNGNNIFPLTIRGNKQLSIGKGVNEVHQQLLPLYQNDKNAKGFGYTLFTSIVNTKQGKIEDIDRIEFSTEDDYLRFLRKEMDVTKFREQLKTTLPEFPELKRFLSEKPLYLADNLDQWEDLLKVCRYFAQSPNPGIYVRELPVAVHTKFVENNTGVITKLLEYIIPDYIRRSGENFHEKFHLKQKHNLIRIRFLDDTLSPLPGFKELGFSETEIHQLNIRCIKVFIIENDIAALTFPPLANSIVIFGKGYNVSSLKGIQWLSQAEIFYWSDLDAQGFEMLSQVRGYYRHTKSLLMDMKTLLAFKDDWGKGVASVVSELAYLTEEETAVHKFLLASNIRLEQEKIPNNFIKAE